MADEDDRIILLNNRGDTVDEVSPNLRNSGGEDLELQPPGYQVKKYVLSFKANVNGK